MWTYRCTVHRVIDADSLVLDVDLGFHTTHRVHVRLLGVDAPERRTPEGDAATDYVRGVIAHDPADEMTVRTELDRSFARYLGEVVLSDGTTLAERIVWAGHGTYRAP